MNHVIDVGKSELLKTFIFVPGDLKPLGRWGNCQYLLHMDWLPPEAREDDYTTEYFIGIWEDGKWWIRDMLCENDDDTYAQDDKDHILRPIFFTPIQEDLGQVVIGWCPLFSTRY